MYTKSVKTGLSCTSNHTHLMSHNYPFELVYVAKNTKLAGTIYCSMFGLSLVKFAFL